MKITITLIIFCIQVISSAQIISFTGYGRARIMNESLKGNVVKGDTAVPKRGTDGDMVFDLGIHLQPYEYLRGKALIRLRNKFGVFFGQGAAVEFRQILIEGLISKKIKYALGDIDINGTPYTVFNTSDSSSYEAEIFKTRRDITHYENFNFGNQWRVQGAKANATMLFNNTNSDIKFKTFASRTRATNYGTLPDRFLVGLTADANIENVANVGLNYVSMFEVKDQVDTSTYSNNVATVNFNYTKKTKSIDLTLSGEAGISRFSRTLSTDSSYQSNGSFYDVKCAVDIKPIFSKLSLNYKNVGADFLSPAAQTLRIYANQNNSLFTYTQNYMAVRDQLYFDRLTDLGLYNQTIRPTLMAFLPQYSNVLPYGAATPNRTGFSLGFTAGSGERPFDLSFSIDKLKELKADTLSSLRNFTLIKAGATLRLHQLFKSERLFILSGGIKHENTQRDGKANIDLKSSQMDAGLTLETFKNLDVLGGYKLVLAQGNEYTATRDANNAITKQTPLLVNFQQNLWSAGFRYRFSNQSFLTLTGNWVANTQKENSSANYSIHQYFISYIVNF